MQISGKYIMENSRERSLNPDLENGISPTSDEPNRPIKKYFARQIIEACEKLFDLITVNIIVPRYTLKLNSHGRNIGIFCI